MAARLRGNAPSLGPGPLRYERMADGTDLGATDMMQPGPPAQPSVWLTSPIVTAGAVGCRRRPEVMRVTVS